MPTAIGATTALTLEATIPLITSIVEVTHTVDPNILILMHGGPIAEPSDAEYVLTRVKGLAGFYGASSMERLPVEKALRNVTEEFKSVKIGIHTDR